MGVRHMMTFLKSTVQRTRRLKGGTNDAGQPTSTIVYDALGSLERYFNQGCYVWDFDRMRQAVLKDVNAFRAAGFNLLVVLDGGVDPRKFKTWFRRREDDLAHLRILNDYLISPDRHMERHGPLDDEIWAPPPGKAQYLGQAFRHAGCEVRCAVHDADPEIAWLAKSLNAYGVMTCDTDFVLFPGVQTYLDSRTLKIGKNSEISVEAVSKSELCKQLRISQEDLPAVAGILGNDIIEGSYRDIKKLMRKWEVNSMVAGAAMEVANMHPAKWPWKWEEAKQYYALKKSKLADVTNPKGHVLLKEKMYVRGVAMERLGDSVSTHEVLAPLCRAVYSRNGVGSVKEHLCVPSMDANAWRAGWTVRISQTDPKAPEPPSDPKKLAIMVCQYLRHVKAISDFHFCALVAQVADRDMLKERMQETAASPPDIPRLDDLHACNLYLNAIEVFWMGADGNEPCCWDIFDGVLYHTLCQTDLGKGLHERADWKKMSCDWNKICVKPLFR
ncbi:hypothetical protein BSKO_05104 [Bryopsis sp. KO-2023]|nr:hypothetical protein BSKO_05104 [Bryopsis sp. KO-2023]